MMWGTERAGRRRRLSRSLAAAAVALAALSGCTGTGSSPDPVVSAPAACEVRYVIRAQPAGFTADVSVTNHGGRLHGWTVGFDFPGADQRLLSGWNATWAQAGTHVTATSSAADLASGASATAGFDGTGTVGTAPAQFTLDGVVCALRVDSDAHALATTTGHAPALHVAGNQIVDQSGRPSPLLGVNRSGGEYMCVHGSGIWDGPVGDDALAAIGSWNVTAVRVPLNEDCWLSLGGVDPQYSGARYRSAVAALVASLEAHGLNPVLDLHWSDGRFTGDNSMCPSATATCQKPMPDGNAVTFWKSVAETFRPDGSVVFDLFNEPYPSDTGTMSRAESWNCWLRGGSACQGLDYPVAGMQQLVDAVRSTGAGNLILVSANSYSRDLTGWLAHRPQDPTGNLAAAWHWYNDGSCDGADCWQRQVGPVAERVPVVATEIGEMDCSSALVTPLMGWLDGHGVSYLAWSWNTWGCADGPALISDWSGTPTPYGQGVRDHLQSR
ncbi:cellulase family glycosylhydrolase [Rugosimonospora africana]|uniref:Endoglucanase n=1 Tax=Rugosimonospora africana TaxID=556532 RepID=A0A8J3VPX4_9ACTN|nr:cellulase family glycosylhydrolase [Rugosimonospora africana]GIH13871.1 endoglucanase [Rugosimonospora africana]